MRIVNVISIICAAIVLSALVRPAASAEPTLAAVKKRGELVCGVNGLLPGMSSMDAQKKWTGFEVDFCRAIAAAVLGDAGKVKLVPLTTTNRFDALRSGEVDVLLRNTSATLARVAGTGVRDAVITYIDGQAVAVPKKLNASALKDLDKATICTLKNTVYGPNIEDWFESRRLTMTLLLLDTQTAMYEAFYAGKCSAVTQDITALSGTIVASGRAADYLVLPDIVGKNPQAAWVRTGDDEWAEAVRWTLVAMVDAEELGISQSSVDERRTSGTAAAKRLLGVIPGNGKLLKLDEAWAYNVIKQVGNYREVYERNVGTQSFLKFPRGINALWNQGGVMFAMPLH